MFFYDFLLGINDHEIWDSKTKKRGENYKKCVNFCDNTVGAVITRLRYSLNG